MPVTAKTSDVIYNAKQPFETGKQQKCSYNSGG